MNKQRIKILAAVSLGILALAFCLSASGGKSPISEVILESESWQTPEGTWVGPAIIWVDGVKYEGTILYNAEGKMNKNNWHGTETHWYDFGDLGTFGLSGTAKTSFDYVTPEHRWHYYTSHVSITDGTGAFEEAHGVFQIGGYTDWHMPPFPPDGYAWSGATAMIVGIQLPE
jgi:hypothetical protein